MTRVGRVPDRLGINGGAVSAATGIACLVMHGRPMAATTGVESAVLRPAAYFDESRVSQSGAFAHAGGVISLF